MFDKFVKDRRITTGDVGEMSVELMAAPLRDEEKERLDKIKNDLDLERQRFTEAAIKLGKERAELEVKYLVSQCCDCPSLIVVLDREDKTLRRETILAGGDDAG